MVEHLSYKQRVIGSSPFVLIWWFIPAAKPESRQSYKGDSAKAPTVCQNSGSLLEPFWSECCWATAAAALWDLAKDSVRTRMNSGIHSGFSAWAHSSKVERRFPKSQIWVRVLLRLAAAFSFYYVKTKCRYLFFSQSARILPEGLKKTRFQNAARSQNASGWAKNKLLTEFCPRYSNFADIAQW